MELSNKRCYFTIPIDELLVPDTDKSIRAFCQNKTAGINPGRAHMLVIRRVFTRCSVPSDCTTVHRKLTQIAPNQCEANAILNRILERA